MKKIFLLCVFLLISACVENPENRGYMTESLPTDKLIVGETSKEEVLSILGSPSVTSEYGDDAWYYIGLKMVRKASFMPLEQRSQHIVEVYFDENDKVKAVLRNTGDSNRTIQFTKDETPTEGNEVTLTEQLLGNFGKFNKGE